MLDNIKSLFFTKIVFPMQMEKNKLKLFFLYLSNIY